MRLRVLTPPNKMGWLRENIDISWMSQGACFVQYVPWYYWADALLTACYLIN